MSTLVTKPFGRSVGAEEQEQFLALRVVHTSEAAPWLVNPDPSLQELAMWQHCACPYDPSSPRDMHRTTIAGDEPIR